MCIVPVVIKLNSKEMKTYAMLDSCSQGSFIAKELLEEVGGRGISTNITVQTLSGRTTEESSLVKGIKVRAVSCEAEEGWIDLPRPTLAMNYLLVERRSLQWKS